MAAAKKKSQRTDLSKLIDAVYARPLDDAPRLVLGDAYLEAGDPRGELIAEQRRRTGATPSKLERALVKKHGEVWLGELSSVLRGPSFRLGFVSGASMRGGAHDDAVLAGREWKTLERLFIGGIPEDSARRVLTLAPLDSLREVGSVMVETIQAAAKARGPLPWTTLTSIAIFTNDGSFDAYERLAKMQASLPKLKHLTLSRSAMMSLSLEDLSPLLESKLAQQLERFELTCESEDVDAVFAIAKRRKLKHVIAEAGGEMREFRSRA